MPGKLRVGMSSQTQKAVTYNSVSQLNYTTDWQNIYSIQCQTSEKCSLTWGWSAEWWSRSIDPKQPVSLSLLDLPFPS